MNQLTVIVNRRSPLADALQLHDVKELCSLLVTISGEAAKNFAGSAFSKVFCF